MEMRTNIISAMKTETEIKARWRCVRVSGDLHRRLRLLAAASEQTISSIAERAVQTELHRLEGAPPSAAPIEEKKA